MDIVGMLVAVDGQIPQFVEDDGRGLAEVQDRVVGAGRDRTDLVESFEFVVGQSDPLAPEDDAGVGLDAGQGVGQFSGRLREIGRASCRERV